MKLLSKDKIELVAFDIGKTIFDKECMQSISAETYKAIDQLRNNKIKVGVCTMRTLEECKSLIKADLDFYVCLNGTAIYCEDKLIFNSQINKPINDNNYLVYDTQGMYFSSNQAKTLFANTGFNAYKVEHLSQGNIFVIKGNYECNLAKEYECEAWSKSNCITIQAKGTNKAEGLQRVLDYYNMKSSPIYFGDAPNDLCVFEKYSTCVSMGGCYPELNNYAMSQADTCLNNGVAKVIYKLLENKYFKTAQQLS